jgi:phosphoglycolate phosphatase-like HAD superfamily hydrolase
MFGECDNMFIDCKSSGQDIELVMPFQPREITHVFHDVDGTHSLIRDWVPVMALLTGWVAKYGLPEGSVEEAYKHILVNRGEDFFEARRFAIESAGLSALTQMEWAIRSAVGNRVISGVKVDFEVNAKIIKLIWAGHEIFAGYAEADSYRGFIAEKSTELFKIYEKILLAMCRDRNLADARINQEKWRVLGSMEFLRFLRDSGISNYFITGAVVEHDSNGKLAGTMYEEISTLGYEIGQGRLVQRLYGSNWNKKLPKSIIMRNICYNEEINPKNILIVGDGRSEIAAGIEMGAITMSRLDADAERLREIHRNLKTNIIVEHYNMNELKKIFRATSW